jgi:TonB-dependent siderophore receptor
VPTLPSSAVSVWLSALLSALPLAAEEARPAASGEAAGEGEAPAGEPVATEEEELFVVESLPYAPTSNTIATKLPMDLAWTPANVGVVGQPLLFEQGATVLGDALENVSGANVQTGQGVFDFFVLRGFDSLNNVLVLIDGVPEPEASFYQLYNVERVEVFKGSAGFLYGKDPLSGVVNLVRKQPVPRDFGVVGVGGGSFGNYEGSLDWNASAGDGELTFRLNGLWRETDGYREGKEGRVWAANPTLTWRPSERTSLHVNAELANLDYSPDAGLPLLGGELPPVSRDAAYESRLDRSEQAVERLQVDFERRLSGSLTLRNKTYYRQLDWQTDGTLLFGAFPNGFGGFAVARTLTSLDDRQDFFGNQLEVVTSRTAGKVEHRLLAGLDLALHQDRFTLGVFLLDPVDLLRPVDATGRRQDLLLLQVDGGSSDTLVLAPYVIDQMSFGDRFRLLAGARFDQIEFEDKFLRQTRTDGKLSPMLGAVYSPASGGAAQGLSLYANASGSFAPPSPRVTGERKPEESRQLEVGARKEFAGGRARATLALFQIERENIAIPDDNGFTQQAGDQRARGVELEAAADLGPGLDAVFSYAYTDSELTEFRELIRLPFPPFFAVLDRSGNRSAFAPEHLANLWVSKRLGTGWTLAGGARYVGDQAIAEDNVTEIDGYLLLDAAVSYQLGSYRFTLNLKNLADQEYETRAFGSGSVIPGAPFGAFLRVDFRL